MRSPAAYSDLTGKQYASFDELVDAEASGYVVTAIIARGSSSWPWSVGPMTKAEAKKLAPKLRNRIRKETGYQVSVFVRPLWKEA